MTAHQSSKVTRRARNVPLEWGQWWGSVMSSTTTRITEKDGIQRLAYGEPIAATNNKTYNPDELLCSVCAARKHYLDFHRDSRYTWRKCRRYECIQCEKLQVVDQKARRAKRHAKWQQ